MSLVPSVVVAAALAEAATLGDFFTVTPPPRTGEWLPFDALLDPGPRVAAARSVMARRARVEESSIDWRVAASTVSLGLLARLVAPPFAALVSSGIVPFLTPKSLWWQPVPRGPVPLAFDEVGGIREGSAGYARVVLDGLVVPLVEAFQRTGVSPVVLRGNVASALGGAARMIATARPDLAEAAWALTAELLDAPMLAGSATITPGGLRRHSCCLFYRVPGGGFCGDCILPARGAFSR